LLPALPQTEAALAASPPAPLRDAGTLNSSGDDHKPGSESVAGSKLDSAASSSEPVSNSVASAPAQQLSPGAWSSVRTRGLESPVELKPDPEPEAEPADVLDGTPQARQTSHDPKEPAKKKPVHVSPREQRVWPLPERSFVFTQAFGCVPQLGNLYFPGDGCPPDRPVVHTGIDLAAPEGTVFYAAASGWVTLAGYDRPTPDANTRIIIQHDGQQEGYSTEYLHWIASYVAVGDYVRAGEPIGEVGNVGFSTGPHLHFSVIDLATGEHIDPVRWLPPDNQSGAYKGRLPGAEMRLPAGTTAGQPEEADQNPPSTPSKVKVPKSPPPDDSGGASAKHHRQAEEATTDGRAGTASAKHQGKNKRTKNGDATQSDASNSDQTKKRERHKDGDQSERSASGEDRQRKHKDDSEDSDDQTTDTGRGGHRDTREPDKGSRHDSGGSDRGNSDGGGNHDRGGENNNGGQHDNTNHDGRNDGKNNGSNDHAGEGQNKHGNTRKKELVADDVVDDQIRALSSGDSQVTTG